MDTENALIHHFLEKSAELFPDSIAVVHDKKRASYVDINSLANKLSHGLISAGIQPGDRVVLLCENSIEYIFCYYGILKAGGIAVSLNTEIKPEGLAELLKDLEPKAFIASSRFEKTVKSSSLSKVCISRLFVINPRTSNQFVEYGFSSLFEELSLQPDKNPRLQINQNSCAAIIYTSGSAGKPKGVMLSHANIVANTGSIVEYLELTSNDVQMVVLPFFYVMGKSLLNTHFSVGGRVVINNRFAYTASVLKQMTEEGVTGFSGVPSTYAQLLFKSPLAQYHDKLTNLHYCSQAGGHMPKHVKLELLKVLPCHTRLFIMYGATEASARLSYVPPDRLGTKLDSIGIPISGVTMRVLSSEGKALGPGEIGELAAQGDNIMLGYYKDRKATDRVLDRNGYHTGDLGYVDDEGFFYVTGRKDDQLKVGGHRLNPQEIEDIVIESGQAVECIIFAIEDSILGHKLAGLVVPIKEPDEARRVILDYCYQKLPKYKVPASLLMVDAIPKNSNGKPDRIKSMELHEKIAGKGTQDRA